MSTPHIFIGVAVILASLSLWDYRRNANKFTQRGKIWIWMAAIFSLVSLYLIF